MRSRQNLALQHRAAQGLAHDTQTERDNEEHEEGHGVARGVEDGAQFGAVLRGRCLWWERIVVILVSDLSISGRGLLRCQ